MSKFIISADHPVLPGHFPGQPIVPAVVVVDQVLALLAEAHPGLSVSGIRKLKFLMPLRAGQAVTVVFAEPNNGRIRFRCECDGQPLAEGNLLLAGQAGFSSTDQPPATV